MIVVRQDQQSETEQDPVYGEALGRTWQWLSEHADAGVVDFGVQAMDRLLGTASTELRSALVGAKPHAPVILPAYVDAWCQTAPSPVPCPDIAPFLHGPETRAAEVQVCWRSDLPLEGQDQDLLDVVAACPPSSAETVGVPVATFRRFVLENGALADTSADAPEREAEEAEPPTAYGPRVVIWRGVDKSRVSEGLVPDELLPGDTLVLPSVWEESLELIDRPQGAAIDCAAAAFRVSRDREIVRIHPALLQDLGGGASEAHARSILRRFFGDPIRGRELEPEDLAALDEELDGLCRELGVRLPRSRRKLFIYPDDTGVVLQGTKTLRQAEEDGRSAASRQVPLAEHLSSAGRCVRDMCSALRLSPEITRVLDIAADAHDLGKCDPRFQAWLQDGNPLLAGISPVLAKSRLVGLSARRRHRAREEAGYPQGARHEMLSAALLQSWEGLTRETDDPGLVLHLVEAHHGHARPFAPLVADDTQEKASCEFRGQMLEAPCGHGAHRLDSGVVERFWQGVEGYGWWGLAYLESLIRLGDWRVSAAAEDD
jgi:CRISPR-associated endonuclease/helicase Cas3